MGSKCKLISYPFHFLLISVFFDRLYLKSNLIKRSKTWNNLISLIERIFNAFYAVMEIN